MFDETLQIPSHWFSREFSRRFSTLVNLKESVNSGTPEGGTEGGALTTNVPPPGVLAGGRGLPSRTQPLNRTECCVDPCRNLCGQSSVAPGLSSKPAYSGRSRSTLHLLCLGNSPCRRLRNLY